MDRWNLRLVSPLASRFFCDQIGKGEDRFDWKWTRWTVRSCRCRYIAKLHGRREKIDKPSRCGRDVHAMGKLVEEILM